MLLYPAKIKILSEDAFLTQAYIYKVVNKMPVGIKALAVVSKYTKFNYGLVVLDDSGNVYANTKPSNTEYFFMQSLNYSLFLKEHKEFF